MPSIQTVVKSMSSSSVNASKLVELAKLSSSIFGSVYNPTAMRTGNKILNKRLVGPTINSYYPNVRQIKLREITRMAPEMKLVDQAQQIRLEDLAEKKKRGKGPPKKGEGRRSTMKKK